MHQSCSTPCAGTGHFALWGTGMGSGSPPPIRTTGTDRADLALAAAWMLVPALQYAGTLERTALVTTGAVPMEALAGLDLTPVYAILLVATILRAALTAMKRPVTTEGAHDRS